MDIYLGIPLFLILKGLQTFDWSYGDTANILLALEIMLSKQIYGVCLAAALGQIKHKKLVKTTQHVASIIQLCLLLLNCGGRPCTSLHYLLICSEMLSIYWDDGNSG